MIELKYATGYFATARERYQIMLARAEGQKAPWTADPQFRQWRFCNVHREDDRTTVWFREAIRDPLSKLAREEQNPEWASTRLLKVVRATVAFRWFNRIETGQIIQDLLLGKWDSDEAERRLDGVSPVVTGAYIIKGMDGYPKLEGVLRCINEAFPKITPMVSMWEKLKQGGELTLRVAWNDLTTLNYMGGFMSYEAVSDLRWTPVLDQANDINTWANAGPGCARGLSWVCDGQIGRFGTGPGDQKIMLPIMRELLDMSRDTQFWPAEFKRWEMREVEHWSCEFDKMCRARAGESMKRRFTPRS